MNEFDNTNNKSAMTKQFKSNGCVGLQGSNNNDNRTSDRKAVEKHQMNLQKGAGGQKFQLGCAISESMHSSSRVRN